MQRLQAVRRGALAAARSMATAAPPTGEADLAVKVRPCAQSGCLLFGRTNGQVGYAHTRRG